MIVTMELGIGKDDTRVSAIVEQGIGLGLKPEVRQTKGSRFQVTEVYMLDGSQIRSATVPDHTFQLQGVAQVRRVSPPEVTLSQNGNGSTHALRIGNCLVGEHHPCLLVAGPCTVDRYVERIIGALAKKGIRDFRGGAWKPRSEPGSFPGFGEPAVRWLFDACVKHNARSVWTEVMESEDIEVVREAQKKSKFKGDVVLWVGARTKNLRLLQKLGEQRDCIVMLKNDLHFSGVMDHMRKAGWVLNVTRWDKNGKPHAQKVHAGNHRIILCLRGVEKRDPESPLRFDPNFSSAEILREKGCWAATAMDPSHIAGRLDLIWPVLNEALRHKPHILIVEGGYPNAGFKNKTYPAFKGFCDVKQMVPIEEMGRVIKMVEDYNREMRQIGWIPPEGS